MKAWLFQDTRQKQKLGDKAPWSVGWFDPDGKKRSKRIGLKSAAEKYRRRIEGELAAGTYDNSSRKPWATFRQELETRSFPTMSAGNRRQTENAITAFERICKPKIVSAVKSQHLDEFKAKRIHEKSRRRKGEDISPATVNKELRHIKIVLRIAHDWGYLPRMPRSRALREPEKHPRFVTAEHFADIYQACDVATMPGNFTFAAADWWRALLTFVYMTGWRIGEPLALRREDVDFEKATALTRHTDNKGKRDDIVPLHPVILEHLDQIWSFEPAMFPWHLCSASLYNEFHRIQRAAGLSRPWYGFHDLRRAFATVNAESLSADELQVLMRHRSYSTTKRYINMAKRLNKTADKLHVPEFLKAAGQ